MLGKPEGKRPLGRLRRRWVDNIKVDVKEICWGVDWIDRNLGRDTCKRVNEPWDSIEQACQTEGPPRAIWVTFVLS